MDRSIIQRSVAPSSKGPPASTSGPPVALRKRRPNLPGRLLDQRVISHLGIQRPPRGLRTARQGVRAAGSERLDACDRRTVVVWEEATAVRHRVLMRPSADGRTFSPERILSEAVKASPLGPDVAVTPRGEFIAAWQEQGSSSVKTVVRTLRVATP